MHRHRRFRRGDDLALPLRDRHAQHHAGLKLSVRVRELGTGGDGAGALVDTGVQLLNPPLDHLAGIDVNTGRDRLAFAMATTWTADVVRKSRATEAPYTASLKELRALIYESARDLAAQPAMLRTWARASLEVDAAFATAFVRETHFHMKEIPPSKRADPEHWALMVRLMDAVFWSGVSKWAYGHKDFDEVPADVDLLATICAFAFKFFDD